MQKKWHTCKSRNEATPNEGTQGIVPQTSNEWRDDETEENGQGNYIKILFNTTQSRLEDEKRHTIMFVLEAND